MATSLSCLEAMRLLLLYACVSESVLKRLVVRYDAVVEDDF
ncbi:hypothetical protein SAMN05216411_1141, partial [Nitrosospira multiformis]